VHESAGVLDLSAAIVGCAQNRIRKAVTILFLDMGLNLQVIDTLRAPLGLRRYNANALRPTHKPRRCEDIERVVLAS